jgi:sugar diacid utilization regulator
VPQPRETRTRAHDGPEPGEHEFQALILRAHRSRRRLANALIADCVRRLPHYRDMPAEFLADVRDSVVHHLSLFYRVTLEAGRPLCDEDLAFSRRLARLRATQGVPMGPFLTYFLVGLLAMAWRELVAGAGDDPVLRARLFDRVSVMISNQTQLMAALTEAYVEERERQSRFREQDLDDFAELLLSDDSLDTAIESRARALGLALDEPRAIAVFAAPSSAPSASSAKATALQQSLAGQLRSDDVRVARAREGFVALLPADPKAKALATAAEALLGDSARVGVGGPGRGVTGLRRALREALRALRIATGARGGGPVRAYRDVAVLDLVGVGSAAAGEFAESVLGALATQGDSRAHLATLRALAQHGYRLKGAAAALAVHPHTLSYRVKQIRARHGLDLGDPDVRLRIDLALRILEAQGA